MRHTLRRMTAADADAVAGLHVRSWQAGYKGLLPDEVIAAQSVDERRAQWEERATDAAALTIVAENEQAELSGFCTAYLPSRDEAAPGTECEIAALYIEPERRRWGIGRALLRATLDHAVGAGYESVTLWVLDRNEPAIRLYEDFAFKPDGQTATVDSTDAVEIRMRLTLA